MISLCIFVNKFSQLKKKKKEQLVHWSFLIIFCKKVLLGYRCIAFSAIFPDFTFLQALVFPIPHIWLVTSLAFLGCRTEHSPFRHREGLEKTSGDFLPADFTWKGNWEKVAFLRPYPAAARDPPGPWRALENPQCFANSRAASHSPWTAGRSQSTVNFSELLPNSHSSSGLLQVQAEQLPRASISPGAWNRTRSPFFPLMELELTGEETELSAPQIPLCVLRAQGGVGKGRRTKPGAHLGGQGQKDFFYADPISPNSIQPKQNNCLLPWRNKLSSYRA